MKRILFAILFLLFATSGWAANTYYAKTGGNDSAAGTSDATAWAHCPGMADWTGSATLSSGDKVYFREGDTFASTSESTPLLTATAGVTYYGLGYGSGGTRAKLQAGVGYAGGDTSLGIVKILVSNVSLIGLDIDGNQKNTSGIVWGWGNAAAISDFLIDNCLVHDMGDPTNVDKDPDWEMYGILISSRATDVVNTDVLIKDSSVYNNYHEGIAIYPAWSLQTITGNDLNRITVRNCSVYNNGTTTCGDGNGIGIAVNNDSDNVTIEYCNIYDTASTQLYGISFRTSPDPGETYGRDGAPNDYAVRYNLIHGNTYYGIFFQDNFYQDFTGAIYGNLFFNNLKYGLYIGSYNWGNSTFDIYNNTFYLEQNGTSTYVGCVGFSRDSSTISGTPTFTLKNNIMSVVTTSTSAYDYIPMYADYGSGTFVHSNNLYYRSTGTTRTYVSVGNWGSHTYYDGEGDNIVTAWEATAQVTDPTFTGGDLPTGFSGTYGTDMVPNKTYFAITSGNALGNGAVLASPYNKAINNAGTSDSAKTRGTAWDIGAYEYTLTGGATIVNTGAVMSGCSF